MPINPNFKKTRSIVKTQHGINVWGPINEPVQMGIHGDIVAVDMDLCYGCMKCVDVCTVNVFEKIDTPKHPESKVKVDPIREEACFFCLICEIVCPVDCILIERQKSQGDTLQALLDS